MSPRIAACLVVLLLPVAGTACKARLEGPIDPSVIQPVAEPVGPSAAVKLTLRDEQDAPEVAFGQIELGEERFKKIKLCNESDEPALIEDYAVPEGFFLQLAWAITNEHGVQPQSCGTGSVSFLPLEPRLYAGDIHLEADVPVLVEGRLSGTGFRRSTPRTVFGEGTHFVNVDVAAGRYFADPNGECGWTRLSRSRDRYPPDPGDVIATRTSWFDPRQWIVDLLPTDVRFVNGPGCGWWDQIPKRVPDVRTIMPGMWLVDKQVRPGLYRAAAAAGCTWERLRHFQGTPDGVIATGATSAAGSVTIAIARTDAGFLANSACGTWTRVS